MSMVKTGGGAEIIGTINAPIDGFIITTNNNIIKNILNIIYCIKNKI